MADLKRLLNNPVASLVRDLKRVLANHKYEMDGATLVVPSTKLAFDGYFNTRVLRKVAVQKAIEAGDKLAELLARATPGGEYLELMPGHDHNLVPEAGRHFILNLVYRPTAASLTTNNTWYHGPFKGNVTPGSGWASNWAGATGISGANELTAAEHSGTGRKLAVFANAPTSGTLTASTPTEFELVLAGATTITLYGSTLNSVSDVAYNATDKILIAATRFGTMKSNLGNGDKIQIEYEIEATSTDA